MFISKSTNFETSNEKFNGKAIHLDEIEKLNKYQLVTVCDVKVLSVGVTKTVKGYRIQEIKIKDDSGTNKLTVWDSEIEKMKIGKRYKISRVCVKEYDGEKFLSTTKEGSDIHLIEDTEDVLGEQKDESGKIRIYIYSYTHRYSSY